MRVLLGTRIDVGRPATRRSSCAFAGAKLGRMQERCAFAVKYGARCYRLAAAVITAPAAIVTRVVGNRRQGTAEQLLASAHAEACGVGARPWPAAFSILSAMAMAMAMAMVGGSVM